MKNIIYDAVWISSPYPNEKRCLAFVKNFKAGKTVLRATLNASAIGVYTAEINGKAVGDIVLAPGWTSYRYRLQYQSYDVTSLVSGDNALKITVGIGWRMREIKSQETPFLPLGEYALIAALDIEYTDGTKEFVLTDESWDVFETEMRYSDMFGGDTCDMTFVPPAPQKARGFMHPHEILVPQICEPVREQERIPAQKLIKTPNGETIIDFGQNLTGYVEFKICGKYGERAVINHAEVLDSEGNFYTENMRTAKNIITFICDGKPHTYKPRFSFQGFRFIRINEFPDEIRLENFTAIVCHSDLTRTGYFECSDAEINQLYHNIIWGQKSNFLDVPTDCPQRDERLGWTGDAQVFCRCASMNYKVDKFYRKWLDDVASDQRPTGSVPVVIPGLDWCFPSAAWSDAAVIVPWQMYLTYGDEEFLTRYFPMMKKWTDYAYNEDGYFKNPEKHFGDWLSTDVVGNERGGSTDKEFIARAFNIYSTEILIRAAKVIGYCCEDYEKKLSERISEFRGKYFDADGNLTIKTQTAHVLTIKFNITPDVGKTVSALAELIRNNGDRLTTGFVGTPYLLHVLSENGYEKLAYTLLFQNKCPSWLYSVEHGATTMWEHWDSIKEDGSFWSPKMNSFNHYAYGAVGDWLYAVAAGINYCEDAPGFAKIVFAPITDERLTFVRASIDTKFGTVASSWETKDGKTTYNFTVPEGTEAVAQIGGKTYSLKTGGNTVVI